LIQNTSQVPPEIIELGEKLEQVAGELKNSVTSSIKSIEETKLNIIKIL
jgi:hypothetical protein